MDLRPRMLRPHLILILVISIFGVSVWAGGLNIRLVNGNDPCSGRVEIYYNNQWGTVCDDNWDISDAAVVCRQMGCGRAVSALHSAHFGQGSDPILLDDVGCSGSESSLSSCSHSGFGRHDCNHGKDAGVICSVNLLQPNISFSAPDGSFHWGSQGPEVIRGHSFSIICSTKPQHPGGSFHLEFSGSNITRTQSAVHHSTTFFFPEADFVHQGNYSCVHEVTVSSGTFKSPNTELLVVTVKASLAPFIGSGVAAGLLLILVPIIIFFIKRCKKQKYQMAVKTDHKHCARNTYRVTGGRTEMDDGEVYENAENVFHQKEDSDNSSEDYINVGAEENVGNDYAGAKTTCGISNTGNETDDDDYENAEVCVHQREDSDVSNEDCIYRNAEAEQRAVDNDYEDKQIYANLD